MKGSGSSVFVKLPNKAIGTQSAKTNNSLDERKPVDVENCAAKMSSSLGLDIFVKKTETNWPRHRAYAQAETNFESRR